LVYKLNIPSQAETEEAVVILGGFVFNVPERYTPQTRLVPTADEVAPWIEMIIRLWDDNHFYAQERRRCLAAAEAWHPDRLLPRFEEFFTQVLHSSARPRSPLACG
jgi:hypothetical protein